jgi:hypothetical protein
MAAPLLLPLALKALPGVASGIANLFGAKRRRQQEDKAGMGISQLTDLFKQQLQGDYFDTGEAQAAMTQIEDSQINNNRAINASAATMGMTDEARIGMMGKNNAATAGGMSNLARSADLWRQRITQQYGNSLGSLFQVGQTNRGNFNKSLQNIFNPMQSAVDGAVDLGAFDN